MLGNCTTTCCRLNTRTRRRLVRSELARRGRWERAWRRTRKLSLSAERTEGGRAGDRPRVDEVTSVAVAVVVRRVLSSVVRVSEPSLSCPSALPLCAAMADEVEREVARLYRVSRTIRELVRDRVRLCSACSPLASPCHALLWRAGTADELRLSLVWMCVRAAVPDLGRGDHDRLCQVQGAVPPCRLEQHRVSLGPSLA